MRRSNTLNQLGLIVALLGFVGLWGCGDDGETADVPSVQPDVGMDMGPIGSPDSSKNTVDNPTLFTYCTS